MHGFGINGPKTHRGFLKGQDAPGLGPSPWRWTRAPNPTTQHSCPANCLDPDHSASRAWGACKQNQTPPHGQASGSQFISHRQQTLVIITLSRTKETSSSVSSTSAGCCSGQHAAILILREHASTCRLPPDPSLVVMAGSPQPVAAKLLQGLLSEGSDPIKHRDFTCWEMRALEFFSRRVRKAAPKLRAVSGPELRRG